MDNFSYNSNVSVHCHGLIMVFRGFCAALANSNETMVKEKTLDYVFPCISAHNRDSTNFFVILIQNALGSKRLQFKNASVSKCLRFKMPQSNLPFSE